MKKLRSLQRFRSGPVCQKEAGKRFSQYQPLIQLKKRKLVEKAMAAGARS
jgi:hypothetical protein